MTDAFTRSYEEYPLVDPSRGEKVPGSTTDFIGSRAMQLRFNELGAKFIDEHRYIEPKRALGAPATATVVEQANSQVPTPEA